MKISTPVLLVISGLFVIVSAFGAFLSPRAEGAVQEVIYASPRITCGACVEKLNKAIQPLVGVHKVAVDVASNQVKVNFDPALINPGAIAFAMADAGYPARLADEKTMPQKASGGCGGACCGR